jgi:prevent-host-death family protein
MSRQLTATEVKTKLLALLDEVESGEEIEITRHGRTVARLTPARGPHALKDRFAGRVWSNVPDEELYSTGETWDMESD